MKTFESIAEEIIKLHKAKNADYGNAFGKSFSQYESLGKGEGLKYAIGRIGDKVSRLQNLAFSGKSPSMESIEDNLIDLAAYSIMTLVELNKGNGQENKNSNTLENKQSGKISISDNEFWKVVSSIGWKKLCMKYEFPVKEAKKVFRKKYADQSKEWVRAFYEKVRKKEERLDKVLQNTRQRIGDDSYWDLKAHIVGCGKAAFYDAIADAGSIPSKYIFVSDNDGRYRENFEYVFNEKAEG